MFVNEDCIYTTATTHSVGEEIPRVFLAPIQYGDYIWDEVKARVDQLCDAAQPFCHSDIDHIAELMLLVEFHQLDSGTNKMFITLLPDENPSGTVKGHSVAMFYE